MSEDKIVAFKGVTLHSEASNEMADILERMAIKARSGEFTSMTFSAVMKNHSAYHAWHVSNKADVYAAIGATQCLISDLVYNSTRAE